MRKFIFAVTTGLLVLGLFGCTKHGFDNIESLGKAYIEAQNGTDVDAVRSLFPSDDAATRAVQCTSPIYNTVPGLSELSLLPLVASSRNNLAQSWESRAKQKAVTHVYKFESAEINEQHEFKKGESKGLGLVTGNGSPNSLEGSCTVNVDRVVVARFAVKMTDAAGVPSSDGFLAAQLDGRWFLLRRGG